jgi:hypothetical protein
MPTPLPDPANALHAPPDPAEVELMARGVLSAVRPPAGNTDFQRLLIGATFEAMTQHAIDPTHVDPIDATSFAAGLARRDAAFRTRMVQIMLLGALVLRPIPIEVADRVAEFARELLVDDGMLRVAHEFAEGHLGLAAFDFERNGYTADWNDEHSHALHTSKALAKAWDQCVADDALAARWAALETLPEGTLGRSIWEFYRARGFEFPGRPGSAPPLLAQHDWVHVLADYGTRVESELEVMAFIARANDDARGFSLLAMVVSLFETGYLATGAGLFESSPGQLSHEGMAVRVADAMRRGALCHGFKDRPDIDFMALDWFEIADRPVAELRAELAIPAKSAGAIASGSVGPWEPRGISEFQDGMGRGVAERDGRPYESYGAAPA